MKLIIQPEDGLTPLLRAVRAAKKSIDIVIFRFDRLELEEALEAAVTRGVVVRALIAHTNRGGEKTLRKLETRMLAKGITVARTADDLPRYHAKMLLVDATLHVLGFNFTRADIDKSRSLGIVTHDPRVVKDASALFEADTNRQTYAPSHDRFVVSPETSRERLTAFIKGAKKQLCIYDPKVSDNAIQRLLEDRAKAGVEIRIIGKLEKALAGVETRKLTGLRLHVRAMIRDGTAGFVGSQSLRKLELEGRREVGLIVRDSRIARKMLDVFEADWKDGIVTNDAAPPSARASGKVKKAKARKG
ncbi:MAG: phospholipase D-like domain-containing protein [Acidobacteriota bacterium]|nr:phospholipase D-like domain-containing protein [Acidobacteriota bacterium]